MNIYHPFFISIAIVMSWAIHDAWWACMGSVNLIQAGAFKRPNKLTFRLFWVFRQHYYHLVINLVSRSS